MDKVAGEIDKIVSSLVSEAEAHARACAEQLTQSVSNTELLDRADSTWNEARGVDGNADADRVGTATTSGTGIQHSVYHESQQPLSTSSIQQPETSASQENFVPKRQLPSVAVSQEQAPELQQLAAELLQGKADVPESVAKNNKLLALKQRRLGSLSSSLDLSRESSFDSSQHHAPHEETSPLHNSFAETVAHDSTSAMQASAAVNEQASVILVPLPLNGTTGTPERLNYLCLHRSSYCTKQTDIIRCAQ